MGGNGAGLSSARFHPDGVLLGCGTTTGKTLLYDLKSSATSPALTMDAGKASVSLSFSENGYYVATASENQVKLWDLRKQETLVRSHELPTSSVGRVAFDPTGTYLLATSAADASVFHAKSWIELCKFSGAKKGDVSVPSSQATRRLWFRAVSTALSL